MLTMPSIPSNCNTLRAESTTLSVNFQWGMLVVDEWDGEQGTRRGNGCW
jgi:hypothetical protein